MGGGGESAFRRGFCECGSGGRLSDEMKNYASERGRRTIGPNIADINSDARQLYEQKEIFAAEILSFLRRLFGVGGAAKMKFCFSSAR